jgi:hypothetical protein
MDGWMDGWMHMDQQDISEISQRSDTSAIGKRDFNKTKTS